jgi:predicted Zn-dependent protease
MMRTFHLALLLGLLLARPVRPAQQPNAQPPNQNQKQDPGESSSRANPEHPQPAEASTESAKDAAAADAAGAAHDMEVAEYYLRKGDVDAAIGRLQDAIQLQPKLPRPYLLLAQACERKRDKAAAAKYYREYLRVSPTAPDAQKIQKKIEKLTAR